MIKRLGVLAAVAALAAGCKQEQYGTVQIFQVCDPPEPDNTTGACEYPAGRCGKVPLGRIGIDLALTDELFLGVEVHNQLLENESDTQLDTHQAFIDGYEVSYAGPLAVPTIQSRIQSVVAANGSSVIGIRLVEGHSAAALAGVVGGELVQMVANLSVFGHYGDGTTFETAPLPFGIEVCQGCSGIPDCPTGQTLFGVCSHVGMWPVSILCKDAAASGGGGTGTGSSYSIGGVISNLTTDGLRLSTNGQTLTVAANSSTFTFQTEVATGTNYSVTIAQQPNGQACAVARGGSGTVASADVTTVEIECN